jgi:ribose transport system ATP-binding protein
VVVTLGTFFGLQGVSLLLRPLPTGSISDTLLAAFGFQIGLVPIAALATLAVVFTLELGLFKRHIGRSFSCHGLGSCVR